jgi:plasmid maintenance system antidote protein VapI
MYKSIREYKELNNLTVEELAKVLGYSKRQTDRFLSGEPMKPEMAIAVEKRMGIPKEQLVFTRKMLDIWEGTT